MRQLWQGHGRVGSKIVVRERTGIMAVMADTGVFRLAYNTEHLDSTRATINMDHNNVSLTISPAEAAKAEDEAKRRLLATKKLSLVVDIDLTIIQATVEQTVADWQNDPNNPNHDAVKDVRKFLLRDDGPEKYRWYFIKLRPGLKEFLENVSKIYELHIYTMATRAYAKNIADIIDPDHKYFGDRILSRDESGSLHAKTLQRLFPVDTKMVVIIDDRADVWKWSPNLVKVTPYNFFLGTGDINSTFLPKKPKPGPKLAENIASAPASKQNQDSSEGTDTKDSEPKTNGDAAHSSEASSIEESESKSNSDVSPLEQLVAMGGGDDAETRQAQSVAHDEALEAQVEEKPLLQKQKQLEAADAAIEAAAKEDKDSGSPPPSVNESGVDNQHDKPKHHLLQDHDRELYQLEHGLRTVHTEFFNIYRNELASLKGGRLGQLRGAQKRRAVPDPTDNLDLDLVPDIKIVLPAVKSKVLAGVVIVFSGVFKLGDDIEIEEKTNLAKSFGAQVEENVTKHTTHVVAARERRTLKVKKALRRGKGRIKIVNLQWFTDSIMSFQKKDESSYLLNFDHFPQPAPIDDDEILSESESLASETGDDTDNTNSRNQPKPALHLRMPSNADETGSEASFGGSDVPSELDIEEGSPIGGTNEDWSAMNDELAEFLGGESDGEGSVASEASTTSKLSVRGIKRGREENDSDRDSEDGTGGKVKKKQALGNGLTSLSQELSAERENGRDMNGDPDATGEDNDEEDDDDEGEVSGEEGDGWSDFEGDLEAELEKAGSEEQAQGEG